ncbi:methyltransferase domain-containing protein [Streptomyces harbinensis]|uniref:class I SAM-dependent methyltransferase n=1 Tax=Streptomyces harbinensis TaxID=1176198 RepID=UPI00159238D1|nr:methyltransferase domain-containing protein [Streptomyces harbinensis]QKV70638.1 methyltransferase domain-containing protein [Streptomyces harbinensis]
MNDVALSPPPSPSPVLPGRRAGGWTFLLEAARDLRTTGAVAPSGRALARVLTEPVRAARGPRPLSVLEAGAGTGAVTRVLLARLPVGGELDIVEANPRFAAGLDRLAAAYRAGPGGRAGRVAVHRGLVEEFGAGRRYDVIVSGLPLTNFAPEQVERIMARYLELLRPGGTLSYFAYLGTGAARSLVASRAEARRHAAVEEVMAGYQQRYGVARWRVWANLPPAGVWHLRR